MIDIINNLKKYIQFGIVFNGSVIESYKNIFTPIPVYSCMDKFALSFSAAIKRQEELAQLYTFHRNNDQNYSKYIEFIPQSVLDIARSEIDE
jgi:hypothetical protein